MVTDCSSDADLETQVASRAQNFTESSPLLTPCAVYPENLAARNPVLKALLRQLRARADERLPPHLRDARRGEDLAYDYLCRLGYRIVARNYRAKASKGEIDLVGWDGDHLAFVEVKTRASEDYGTPDSAVGVQKRRFVVRTAHEYVRRANADPACMRFDIVSVVLAGAQPRVSIEKNAFSSRFRRGRYG